MPHLSEFQDNRSPRRLWLLLGLLVKGLAPGEHGLRGDPEEERDAVHRQTTQIPQDGIDLHRQWLAARGRMGKLISTLLALFLGFTRSRTIVDESLARTLGTCPHRLPLLRYWP